MPTTEVVLRPGDSLTLKLELAGQTMRLDLSLSAQGVAISRPAPQPAPQPAAVNLDEEFADEPEPARPASLAAVEPLAHEPVQAVDVSFDEEPAPAQSGPATVQDSGDDLDLDLGDLEGDMEEEVTDDAPAVDIPADDAPAPDEAGLDLADDSFSADGMTMVPPTRKAAEAKPLEAISATLQPLNLQDPSTDALADTGEPDMGDKSKFAPSKDDTLPVWTGKARDYKDPILEKKKQTGVINKAGMQKPGTGPVKPGLKPAPGKPAPAAAKPPAPPPAEDDGLSLSLEEEEPAPAPVPAAKAAPAKPLPGKPLPGKKPTGPVTAPKPAAAASGKAAPAKPAPAAAEGDFTVFLSPPKGADKKQQAAEIIAEIQGISVNEALALAGKMIVPVVKGVSEKEAHSVRD
ncbi:MAG: hypothetical protein KJ044_00825, partial [Planctomycetes bacterium]|nr:hypothetical protein [Planctomycetota bacterium]